MPGKGPAARRERVPSDSSDRAGVCSRPAGPDPPRELGLPEPRDAPRPSREAGAGSRRRGLPAPGPQSLPASAPRSPAGRGRHSP